MGAPVAAGTAECGEAGGGGEAGADDDEDAEVGFGAEVGMEGIEKGGRNDGFGGCHIGLKTRCGECRGLRSRRESCELNQQQLSPRQGRNPGGPQTAKTQPYKKSHQTQSGSTRG